MGEITSDMSERAYDLAAKAFRGEIKKAQARKTLVAETQINQNSAADLINNFAHLIRGEVYHRTLNFYTTSIYLTGILRDFDRAAFTNALRSVTQNLDYLVSKGKGDQPKVRKLVAEFESKLGLPHDPTQAVDLHAPPDRIVFETSRIIRNTALANELKALHDYECQICGHWIRLADGLRYAEGHHIRPLGTPHNGPDVRGNILIVCPNHHAECDFGAILLDLDALHVSSKHEIAMEFVDYHNSHIFKRVY